MEIVKIKINDLTPYEKNAKQPEKATSEKAAAEKAAAEKVDTNIWELSDREREIVKSLGK